MSMTFATNDPESLAVLPPCQDEIAVLHQDENFLIINKPAGLLSVPGRHPANHDSVQSRLAKIYPGSAIVHRLDFDTSGIMVIPLNKAALSDISKQFQARSIHKTYTAIVSGIVEQDRGEINLPIAADRDNRPKYKICMHDGKQSLTEYSVIDRLKEKNISRLQLHPVTGRSHQLRLHLQAIGHAILGDVFYASQEVVGQSSRLLLHATELHFSHPMTKKEIQFYSEPPF
jgi:tRNA pseudouridine32 synthase / 23S rRNA pseudouridine746 synthase